MTSHPSTSISRPAVSSLPQATRSSQQPTTPSQKLTSKFRSLTSKSPISQVSPICRIPNPRIPTRSPVSPIPKSKWRSAQDLRSHISSATSATSSRKSNPIRTSPRTRAAATSQSTRTTTASFMQ
jgi:hypothetical protein